MSGTTDSSAPSARSNPLRAVVAWIGSQVIYSLIRVFGKSVRDVDAPWLLGPIGGIRIGDRPYEECARREGLHLVRHTTSGGLLDDFTTLRSDVFDPHRVNAQIRRFYEHTATYRMDLWAKSWFPANMALWLLVTTISREVDQLNFPLDALETARGLDSEIVSLRDDSGQLRYAGWYRTSASTGRSVYTGFYTTTVVPRTGRTCVKVVFPMPDGNATVILEPRNNEEGDLELTSSGSGFGDVGFYRVQRIDAERMRVWRIRTLREHFRLYVDKSGTLRCDHRIRFLGLPVLQLHFRMETKRVAPSEVRFEGEADGPPLRSPDRGARS